MSSMSRTVRMEDVVYTLNNIMDDIDRMYADSMSPAEDTRMEDISSKQERVSEAPDFNLPAVPSSPTLSSAVLGDQELDSDSASLYSSSSQSPASTPPSSNLTTPATSPTASTFLAGEQVQIDAPNHSVSTALEESSPDRSSWPGLENVDCSLLDPSLVLLPASMASCSDYELNKNLAASPFAHLLPSTRPPLAAPSMLDDSVIIYQTPLPSGSRFSKAIEPLRTPVLDPMPGVSPPHLTMARPALPPRPITIDTRDPPPHLPALRSPILPSTPKLNQSQNWDAPSSHIDHSATYLRRQRQWVRMNISYGLPEPRAIPPFRPVEHYRKQYVRTYSSTIPPRNSRMGALNRKVSFAPKTLARGTWDPWRRGGALERAILFQRRKLRIYEDPQPWDQDVPEAIQDDERDDNSDGEAHGDAGEDKLSVMQDRSSETQITAEEANDPEAMRLCVRDGKRVNLNPTVVSEPARGSSASPVEDTDAKERIEHDPETMRLCVRNDARVPPPSVESGPVPESGPAGSSAQITVPAQTVFTPRPVVVLNPYAPRTQSPLSRSFVVHPLTIQVRFPEQATENSSAAKTWTWRKCTSMVF